MKSFDIITLLYGITCQQILLTASQCTEGDVRLVGGSGSYEGNVQICHEGKWGWVCDNSWSTNDAYVVCRQVGYSSTNAVYRRYSYYGYGNVTAIHLDYVYCNGNEQKLSDCSSGNPIGTVYCGLQEIAGVFCPYGGGCTYGDIRLANFYTNSYGRSEGRVEVCYNNEWGTVCSYSWGSSDATVACRQLGYQGYMNYYTYAYYGYGQGNVWMNYLSCSGNENSLFSCSKSLGSQGCDHYYDAGVRCYSLDNSPCTHNQFRLWSAYDTTPEHEGLMQICKYGTWYTIHDYSSCDIGRVVCKSLGYTGARALRYNAGHYYGYYYYTDNRYWYCYYNADTLSSCYYYSTGTSYYNQFGVVCYIKHNAGESCDENDLRLVNGNTEAEGRVEYCYKGEWAPVCYLSTRTASLMCQTLGYTHYSWGKIIGDHRFGKSFIESDLSEISCSSTDSDLSDCYIYTKSSSNCYVSSYTCSTEYALRCYESGECKDGEVRLVDGVLDQEGRPEVCVNGVWGTICDHSWDNIDAYVFCNGLGYSGINPYTYYSSYYGDGYGPQVWSYVDCSGWEGDLHDCSKNVYPNTNCWHRSVAGVFCKDGCKNGDVRLVGGGFSNEGTVEICFNTVWGQISDVGWTEGDAKVICNQLGYSGGIAKPLTDSFYGKNKKTIHLKDVVCIGDESEISECTKTQLYFLTDGKTALNNTEVAGVDCIYDEPTEPPCIENPKIDPSDACDSPGTFKLTNKGLNNLGGEGRVEYCYNSFWTPLCFMDNKMAVVACKELGYNQYKFGTVKNDGSYGTLLNYSLVQNITCTGAEASVSECTVFQPDSNCLPWCPNGNIGLKCFDPINCEEGSIQIVDGIIEQEGRVEVCIDGVWGAVCDDGWGKTDAHVACQQLGHPELEPIPFYNSYFGDGIYPIIFSKMQCGGWENSLVSCEKEDSFQNITCSRKKTAGVLCGYDCSDGDVRLVGGSTKSEGTVEVCFSNLWGLISEEGWTESDASVVCGQLGYDREGTKPLVNSFYGKPNKTIHISNVQCHGDEAGIHECMQTVYSLMDGKQMIKTVEVAGVKCYVPSTCTPPPNGGAECANSNLRLTGDNAKSGEGILEYCYKGLWSPFCSLGAKEAIIACRQLGYFDYDLASIFKDGRFSSNTGNSSTSYFQNITCSTAESFSSLSNCILADSCQSTCENAIGLKCFANAGCEEGAVRLVDGAIDQEGRVEVCFNNIWGSICTEGFDLTDASVVCKELGLGVYQPTLSYFGDGNVPIVLSNLQCNGYESSVLECRNKEFGTFKCSREKVAGIICQDGCTDGSVRLVGGQTASEGTIEICNLNLWGLISAAGWDNKDADVVCAQMGFKRNDSTSFSDSRYGKPNKTVHLSNVVCSGSENSLQDCDAAVLPYEEGRIFASHVEVAGVSCKVIVPSMSNAVEATVDDSSSKALETLVWQRNGVVAGLVLMMILATLAIVSMVIYIIYTKGVMKGREKSMMTVRMTTGRKSRDMVSGIGNPLAECEEDIEIDEDDFKDVEKFTAE